MTPHEAGIVTPPFVDIFEVERICFRRVTLPDGRIAFAPPEHFGIVTPPRNGLLNETDYVSPAPPSPSQSGTMGDIDRQIDWTNPEV